MQLTFLLSVAYASASKRLVHVLEGPFLTESQTQDIRITVSEGEGTSTGGWSGFKVWPSAVVLLQHVHSTWRDNIVGLNILELGSGLPFLASGLAALGAKVCCTDMLEVLPHIEAALSGNRVTGAPSVSGLSEAARRRIRVQALDWGKQETMAELSARCGFVGDVDLVVGADLVYDEFSSDLLHRTVVDVLQGQGATAVLSLQPRSFPMEAALKHKGQVANFVRSFARLEGWSVRAAYPGSKDGPVIATLTPAGARPSRISSADKPGWQPVRYFTEAVPARDGPLQQGHETGGEL